MLDPTPPYRAPTLSPAPPEPITAPEDTLRSAGISSERRAVYQRRMSSLLAGRGEGPTTPGSRLKSN